MMEGGGSDSAMLGILPAATATLPEDLNYGIELDIGSFFHNDPQLEDAGYEVWTQDTAPVLLGSGNIDEIGRSGLAMSSEPHPVDIFVGENEWEDIEDLQTGEDDIGEDAA